MSDIFDAKFEQTSNKLEFRMRILFYYVVWWHRKKQVSTTNRTNGYGHNDLVNWIHSLPTMGDLVGSIPRYNYVMKLLDTNTADEGDHAGAALLFDIKHELLHLFGSK